MTKSNDGWVPEVGDICEFKTNPAITEWMECKVLHITRFSSYLVELGGTEERLLPHRTEFREIKTEAEKRRETDIEELTANICNMSDMNLVPASLLAARLNKEGYLKPKPLTDDVIRKILMTTHCSPETPRFRDDVVCKRVENYILGKEEL